jgi:hypothetical protein
MPVSAEAPIPEQEPKSDAVFAGPPEGKQIVVAPPKPQVPKVGLQIDKWAQALSTIAVIEEQLEEKRGKEGHNSYAWEKRNKWQELKKRLLAKQDSALEELKKLSPDGKIDTRAVNVVKEINQSEIK